MKGVVVLGSNSEDVLRLSSGTESLTTTTGLDSTTDGSDLNGMETAAAAPAQYQL